MADTPESLVHRGREGTGFAQVFGREGNPMAAFYKRKQDIDRKAALQADQDRLARDKRDKRLWEITNVDPDKAFAPFNQQVLDAAHAHRQKVADFFNNGGNPDDANFQLSNKQGWAQVNDIALRTNYVKDVLQQTKDTIEKNPYLNYQYYFPKINDMYLDKDGKALPLDKVDVEKIRGIYTEDPGGFNDIKYTKDFMSGLNDNMASYVSQKAMNNGILTTDGETKWKGDVYTPDPNSPIGVKVDANGQPIVNVTPELVNSFMNSDTASRYYNKLAQEQGVDVKDIVRQRVAGIQNNERPSFTKNNNDWMDYMLGGKLKPDELKTSSRVFEHIGNITNAFFDENGKRTTIARPGAREAVGHLMGRKLYNGTVEDAELVPGTNKPGMGDHLGKKVENSPNDRLIVKIKSGTAGRTSVHEIDLTDEGGPSEIWNSFQDTGYMGKKNIAFDAAAEQLKINPKELYRGKEYLGEQQQAEQTTINAWVKGEDYGAMTGKTYDGQPIVKVIPNTSWTGKKSGGYKLTLANGKEVEIAKDDYDSLTDIYRSEAPKLASPATKKATGVKWD